VPKQSSCSLGFNCVCHFLFRVRDLGCGGIAEDVDPMALVGWKVNLPAVCFFQDDAILDDSAQTGVGEIRRYFPGRRNNAPYFDMLITHAHWPLENPGVPTAFQCRADDVYVRLQLQDPGFERPNRVDEENHADGPAKGKTKRGGGGCVGTSGGRRWCPRLLREFWGTNGRGRRKAV
jgi:hypothetical protein